MYRSLLEELVEQWEVEKFLDFAIEGLQAYDHDTLVNSYAKLIRYIGEHTIGGHLVDDYKSKTVFEIYVDVLNSLHYLSSDGAKDYHSIFRKEKLNVYFLLRLYQYVHRDEGITFQEVVTKFLKLALKVDSWGGIKNNDTILNLFTSVDDYGLPIDPEDIL